MKKLEIVMKSSAFDSFKQSAPDLGISEYQVSEVRVCPAAPLRKPRRVYRGQEYSEELWSRVKVEFALADAVAKPVAREIVTMLAPDRVAISTLDEVIDIANVAEEAASVVHTNQDASETSRVFH